MLWRLHPLAWVTLAALAGCAPYDDDPPPATAQSAATEPQAPPPPPAPPAQPPPDAQAPATTSPGGSPPTAPPSAPPSPTAPPAAPAAASDPGQEAPPSAAQWVYSYPSGQWVYTATDGWVWVPANTATYGAEGVPYAYLYTASGGWTWYVSPWGWGPYHYGVWVRHPWRPVGWRGGWAAHPRVFVRLGGHRRRW